MEKFIKNKGITLIALVITIIVLLILAGISINMLSGENSILTQAGRAREKNEEAATREQIKIIILESYITDNIKLDRYKLKTNLEKIGATVIADNFPITAILNGYSYKIDSDGNVEKQEKTDRPKIKVGDYINYEPDTDFDGENNPIPKTYAKEYLAEKYTGNNDNTRNNEDLVQTPMKWQVLKKYEDGSIKLIGNSSSSPQFYTKNATGYNNFVWLLNDICEQLYSKKSKGIIARNVNIEDIEDNDYYVSETKGNWKAAKESYINNKIAILKTEIDNGSTKIEAVDTINNTVTYKKDYSYYPNLYAKEIGSGIDTTNVKTNGIYSSDKYATSREKLDTSIGQNAIKQANNNLTSAHTEASIAINEANYGDVYNLLNSDSGYTIASRIVQCTANGVKFGRYIVLNNNVYFAALKTSNLNSGAGNSTVRPIVVIGPNVEITESDTASSETGTPHTITKY